MKRLPFIILLLAVGLQAQVKKPPIIIDPIKPPVEVVKARFVIDHQDVSILSVNYVDTKLIYEFTPITIKNCNKKKLLTEIDAIKENASKLVVEYMDKRLGKMSQVFLGAMPTVSAISAEPTEEPIEEPIEP
jgi:hypothetical protein